MEPSLGVLGPLRVLANGRTVALRPAQRRLLSILLLQPETDADRETLLDRMWGEALPTTARTALHVHASGLRRALPGLLVTTHTGYRLALEGWRYDRAEYERLASQAGHDARAGRWSSALRTASGAIELWRGAPFDELRDDDFASPEINRLTELWSALTELHARALLANDRTDEAIIRLRDQVARFPLREPLWEQLIMALYRSARKAEALRTFQEARRVLAEELGVEPGPALRLLEERIRFDDETAGAPEHPPRHNLPLMQTSFVGRQADLQGISAALDEQRLVTLVGGPGLGKTRLSVEAGQAVLDRHPDGVWFVPLAEARNGQDVIGAIARAVGLRGHIASLDELAGRVRRRSALLILDNCEHLIGACSEFIRPALSGDGGLRVLATSRGPIGIEEEWVWRIGPLPPAGPPPGGAGAPALASAAVQLFVDRARDADRTYRLTPESASMVAELCRLADGIPLAIELAARWVRALGLAEIRDMLDADLAPPGVDIREPTHHRSLSATMEWSLGLLPPEDRQLFIAASIFKGRFSLEDVCAVCAEDQNRRAVALAIARLVDVSLLEVDRRTDGATLYRTLIPIREFARARLESSAAWEATRDRFVTHYLHKARSRQHDPFSEVLDLRSVDDDLDNLREAFELGLSRGRSGDVARALVPLDMYWRNRYLGWEGRSWLARVLTVVSDPEARANSLSSAALQAQVTNDLDEALRLFHEAVAAFELLEDPIGMGRCLLALAGLHCNRGEWSAGLESAREGRRLVAPLENPSSLAIAAHYIGKNLAYAGQVADGVPELAEAARLARVAGDVGRASHFASTLAYVAVFSDDKSLATRWADEASTLAQRSGSTVRLARALGASAALEARWGDPRRARLQLVRVSSMLEQHEGNEDLFEFLFPAAFLLRREERWKLLTDLLHTMEATLASTSQGYPEPWRATAETWKREAAAMTAADSRYDPPRATLTIEEITGEVRRWVEDLPVEASDLRPDQAGPGPVPV